MMKNAMTMGPLQGMRRTLAGQPVIIVAAAIFMLLVLAAAIGGEALAPHDPTYQDLGARLLPPGAIGPEGRYWLGTEALGRDVLSMLITGARPALFVSIVAVFLAAAAGICAGVCAGYRGGRLADVLLYLSNIQLSFPFFLLAITIVGILRPSVPLVIGVIALGSWVPFARVTYSDTTQIKGLEYVEAVHVMRGTTLRVLARHILPNVLPNVLVLSTFALGTAIVMESGLSFVGLGVPTDTPTWGRMLSEGRDYMQTAWWLTVIPGGCIFLLVLSINVLGEQLRDYSDPKLNRG
ncbi:ABC transporter permease [Achromobacter denitrificans]|uniref:ABC transporter permease n=1 Tax=Achromobacter denitrificans TaxID=32002 RepID=A0ABZ3FYF0_ACHDE|nr:ABC transporter permease [Achromobacter sp.]